MEEASSTVGCLHSAQDKLLNINATGCPPWLRMAAVAKSDASYSMVNGS